MKSILAYIVLPYIFGTIILMLKIINPYTLILTIPIGLFIMLYIVQYKNIPMPFEAFIIRKLFPKYYKEIYIKEQAKEL